MSEEEIQLPELEYQCPFCKGKGQVPGTVRGQCVPVVHTNVPCSQCDGIGFVFTGAGEALYAFLRHAKSRMKIDPADGRTGFGDGV